MYVETSGEGALSFAARSAIGADSRNRTLSQAELAEWSFAW